MKVLGIETSCDDTAAGIVTEDKTILSNSVFSQIRAHELHGGVVPEIAAREHLKALEPVLEKALEDSGLTLGDFDAVAATCGPGLIGGVIIGMMAGKTLSAVYDVPFIGVNHLEAHALSPRLVEDVEFPYLLLLVSGGHTQILSVEDVGRYKLLGTTQDDALGEAFDKCAKMMGFPYPGAPSLEKAAGMCADPKAAVARFPLPRPMKGRQGCDFSFSGLKSAVRKILEDNRDSFRMANREGGFFHPMFCDLAYAFQYSVKEVLEDRLHNAFRMIETLHPEMANLKERYFVVAGGVASNQFIRQSLLTKSGEEGYRFCVPPAKLCTDNGAMVAWAGVERMKRNMTSPLTIAARPRWPLDDTVSNNRL